MIASYLFDESELMECKTNRGFQVEVEGSMELKAQPRLAGCSQSLAMTLAERDRPKSEADLYFVDEQQKLWSSLKVY
jgi:hypothetical protein